MNQAIVWFLIQMFSFGFTFMEVWFLSLFTSDMWCAIEIIFFIEKSMTLLDDVFTRKYYEIYIEKLICL